MNIKILFKTGTWLTVKCNIFRIEKNEDHKITNLVFSDVSQNTPIHIDFEEILAIVKETP